MVCFLVLLQHTIRFTMVLLQVWTWWFHHTAMILELLTIRRCRKKLGQDWWLGHQPLVMHRFMNLPAMQLVCHLTHGFSWVSMGSNGFPWIPVASFKYFQPRENVQVFTSIDVVTCFVVFWFCVKRRSILATVSSWLWRDFRDTKGWTQLVFTQV